MTRRSKFGKSLTQNRHGNLRGHVDFKMAREPERAPASRAERNWFSDSRSSLKAFAVPGTRWRAVRPLAYTLGLRPICSWRRPAVLVRTAHRPRSDPGVP